MSPPRNLFAALLQSLVLTLGVALTAQSAMAAEHENGADKATMATEDENGADKAPHEDMIFKGDAKCTRCHDETEEYPVLDIAKPRHGGIAKAQSLTCTSCHGESDAHVDNPAGTKDRPKTARYFGKKGARTSANHRSEA